MAVLKFNDTSNNKNSIKVIGVGGGGSNAVDNMFREGIKDVDFIIANTDAQALEQSAVPVKIQLGERGKGAGNRPEVGRDAATESAEEIEKMLEDSTEMVFITAGMGGGTGTGGAPVIASIARQLGILTVGIITMPFAFEGPRRKRQAENGIQEMRKYVDTVLVIINDKIRELHQDMKMSEGFKRADNILTTAAKGIAELVTRPGYINVDFEDVKSVMKDGGKALMSSAKAEGENRALDCAEAVLTSPLLADNTIKGAENILLYLASSSENEMSINEMHDITNFIKEESGIESDLIFGTSIDDSLGDAIRITLVATGFDHVKKEKAPSVIRHKLDTQDKTEEEEDTNSSEDTLTLKKEPAGEEDPEEGSQDFSSEIPFEDDTEQESSDDVIRHSLFDDTEPKVEDEEQYRGPELKKPKNKEEQNEEDEELSVSNKDSKANTPEDEMFPGEVGDGSSFRFTTRKKETEVSDSETDSFSKKARERIQRISIGRKIKRKLTEQERDEMERIPAYQRKKIDVDNSPSSEEENDPEYVVGKDQNNEVVVKKNNGYIHKNID